MDFNSADDLEAPRMFCAAPWLEATVRIDGRVLPCCRTNHAFGNIQDGSLLTAWHSDKARRFRTEIRMGRFPTPECRACFENGTASSLRLLHSATISILWQRYDKACSSVGLALSQQLCGLMSEFHTGIHQNAPGRKLATAGESLLIALEGSLARAHSADARMALYRLTVLVRSCLDYLNGVEAPSILAPFRQVNLVSVCNVSCVHCLGNVNDEIRRGALVNGARRKRMPSEMGALALENVDDMTAFFMTGTEFFLCRDWRRLIGEFSKRGILLSLSTNGMLLTPDTVDFLLESNVLGNINVSYDGSTRETVEAIRRGTCFEKLVRHTRYLLASMGDSEWKFPVSLSMVLMELNFHESEGLVRLAARLKAESSVNLHVTFQTMDHGLDPGYRTFRESQAVNLGDPLVQRVLRAASAAGAETGIRVYLGGGELL